MGMPVRVKAKLGKVVSKHDEQLVKLNNKLIKKGIDQKFSFNTEADNKAWLDEINSPKSEQKHLIPEGQKKLTMPQLKKLFLTWTEIGVMEFDIGFGRTTKDEINKICEFIAFFKNDIAELNYADDLIERGELSENVAIIIKSLEKPEEEPEKLPIEERSSRKDMQGGLLLCKSFSPSPFWVIFGNVERPKFMKEKIYKEDIYNNIYRDKKGLGYLLMPLLKIGLPAEEIYSTIFTPAWNMGLRELPEYFLPMVYHLGFNYANEEKNGLVKPGKDTLTFDSTAKEFSEFYTLDELIERFALAMKSKDILQANCPRVFFDSSIFRFKCNGHDNSTLTNLADLLTVLIRAIRILDKKTAESMVNVKQTH